VAVGKVGPHDQRLLVVCLEHRGDGQNLEPRQPWVVVARSGRTGGDPLGHDTILGRIDAESQTAIVRHRAAGLHQHQTATRIAEHHAPRLGLARDMEIVGQRIERA